MCTLGGEADDVSVVALAAPACLGTTSPIHFLHRELTLPISVDTTATASARRPEIRNWHPASPARGTGLVLAKSGLGSDLGDGIALLMF
jgi:hypothetical protein